MEDNITITPKNSSTTKHAQDRMGITFTSSNKNEYPVIYTDDAWHVVASTASGIGKILNNTGQFGQDQINDAIGSKIDEVEKLISTMGHLTLKIVETLPEEDISTTTIYLKLREDSDDNTENDDNTTGDVYDEYIYIIDEGSTTGHWELIGSTQVDLSDYVTNEALEEELNDYVKKDDMPEVVTPDWEAGESEEGYIKNRTHYGKLVDAVFYSCEDTRADSNFAYNDDKNIIGSEAIPSDESLDPNKTYTVTIDGVRYESVRPETFEIEGMSAVGINYNISSKSSFEPGDYCIFTIEIDGAIYLCIAFYCEESKSEDKHSITINGKSLSVEKQLDSKYIKSDIARLTDLKKDWNVPYSRDLKYIENRTHYINRGESVCILKVNSDKQSGGTTVTQYDGSAITSFFESDSSKLLVNIWNGENQFESTQTYVANISYEYNDEDNEIIDAVYIKSYDQYGNYTLNIKQSINEDDTIKTEILNLSAGYDQLAKNGHLYMDIWEADYFSLDYRYIPVDTDDFDIIEKDITHYYPTTRAEEQICIKKATEEEVQELIDMFKTTDDSIVDD